jgi:hypothetical protein
MKIVKKKIFFLLLNFYSLIFKLTVKKNQNIQRIHVIRYKICNFLFFFIRHIS